MLAAIGLALGSILLWPFTLVYRWLRVGNPFKHAQAKRVVILGLDGMDPGLATKFMREGRLPNFAAARRARRLPPARHARTRRCRRSRGRRSPPAPIPASHGIFDFLTRDPCTYAPMLSSTDIRQAKRVLNIGRYVVPLEKPQDEAPPEGHGRSGSSSASTHIFSIIQRVPITFPPVQFRGLLLSGMCVPDLRGSQGTFSLLLHRDARGQGGVHRRRADRAPAGKDGRIRSRIVGPDNSMSRTAAA